MMAPSWQATVRSFDSGTAPAGSKDDGRLVSMATLMPKAAIPAFTQSLAHLTPVTARAARDFAELVTALPDQPDMPRDPAI